MSAKKQSGIEACHVSADGDRVVIQTTPRRAEAILLVLSGCTLQEVGERLGVSRERIRQYMEQAGLRTRERKLFRPQKACVVWVESFARASQRLRDRREERTRRIKHVVSLLKTFVAEHGRVPSTVQLYRLVFQREPSQSAATVPALSHYLGSYYARKKRYWNRVTAVYRLAGLRRNTWTKAPKSTAEFCGRGHQWTEQSTYRWRNVRVCRECQKVRAQQRKAKKAVA